MKLFVLGAACAGKTTLCRHLRVACSVNGVDVNDEILRLNDGAWPSIDRKLEWNQSHIGALRDTDQFDGVISGEEDVIVVATESLRVAST